MGNITESAALSIEAIRDDYVPASDYISPEFLKLEKQHMWPKVWQVACREEEIPKPGNYVVFENCDQSIVVLRKPDGKIAAYHNVCQHRGRKLVEGTGTLARFQCKFHGWQWDLDGRNIKVLDPQDWGDRPSIKAENIALPQVPVDTWAGFVFINLDPNAEPLAKYLDPVPEYLDPFEIGKMRYRWYYSIKVPCNWKNGMEAFNEGYHVFATHPQWPHLTDDVTRTFTFGKHGMFGYPTARMFGQRSARIHPELEDVRENIIAFYDDLNTTLGALYSERATQAVRRLRTEVPAGASQMEILGKMFEFIREAAIASGAGYPDVSFEQMGKAGADWHVFPNLIILQTPDAALVYRVRPWGNDPDWCIFDVWSLVRYAEGAQPTLNRQIHYGDDDWKRIGDVSIVLLQDFGNLAAVQQGMKSLGFRGSVTNPLQESTVTNFHRAIREYF